MMDGVRTLFVIAVRKMEEIAHEVEARFHQDHWHDGLEAHWQP